MVHEIYIIDDNESAITTLKELFKNEEDFSFKSVTTERIDFALKNIPSLIIINEDNIKVDVIELCRKIRSDEDNSITPIIVASSTGGKEHRISILQEAVEYFIKKPVENDYLYYTIKNLIRLMNNNRKISPLTGLPGNVQIHAEMKKRLANNEDFAVLYFDLDNFKSYNDVYGFIKGDEVIKFTAKTISNVVHDIKDSTSFVGHIGGDDFVALVSNADYDKVCQDIIVQFDTMILNYYTQEDAERGYLEVENRKGIIEQFPLSTISIGVVEVKKDKFNNILEIGEIGAQVKHLAKSTLGSSYAIDRRNLHE